MAGLTMSDAELERRVLVSPPVRREVEAVAEAVAREGSTLVQLRATDTGQLGQGVRVVPEFGASPERLVRSTAGNGQPKMLPRWTHDGTGIYGPRRRVIKPKKAGGFLVFKVKDRSRPTASGLPSFPNADGLVFAREVKGRPATHYLADAGHAVASRLGLRWVPSR